MKQLESVTNTPLQRKKTPGQREKPVNYRLEGRKHNNLENELLLIAMNHTVRGHRAVRGVGEVTGSA